MSTRDYEVIAACIAERAKHNATDESYREGWHAALTSVAMNLASAFADDNPRFDTEQFLNATNVTP